MLSHIFLSESSFRVENMLCRFHIIKLLFLFGFGIVFLPPKYTFHRFTKFFSVNNYSYNHYSAYPLVIIRQRMFMHL